MTPDQIVDILTQLGYSTLEEYQRAHNLPASNVPTPATIRSLSSIRFCQLPELFALDARKLSKWPKKDITWGLHPQASLHGFDNAALSGVFQWAFLQWASVADLIFSQVANRPDIVITTGRIDNAGNTLAWSELPNPSVRDQQLQQKFDSSEAFVFSSNPAPSQIDLGAVACHEIGHALGLSHARPGSRNLMAPVYSPLVRTPLSGDVEDVQRRYGPPQASPQPTDPSDPQNPIPKNPGVPIPPNGPYLPLTPITPTPYDPTNPAKKIFPSGLVLPPIAGYTWVALPDAFFPNVAK